jgi:FKBP-type peptidyl-prolyl cis-trans isomerase SlyD
MADGTRELMEEATTQHPFMFISGMGLTLDAFEAQILALSKGDAFDFTLSVDEAYGPYVEEGVQTVPLQMFEIDGKIDPKRIFEGAVVPLMNSEGERFNGTITEITDQHITVDLNHPLAGKTLNFIGTVVEHREATNEELQEMAKMLSGEGGCGGCGGSCGGDCGGCGDSDCGGCGCN